ncbi:unnamed protein product [Arctia plantaginis]|uniref:Uncharacterized protein n=1 Tax=Arctia plantaginis TaxID=874455 RepID=A0A8S1AD48_ARCPL|nr:unnamed protein product [Arctia plantaginis]
MSTKVGPWGYRLFVVCIHPQKPKLLSPISKQRNLSSKRRKVKSPRVFTTRTVPVSQEKTADRSPTGEVIIRYAPVPASVASCTFNSDPPPPSPPLPSASPCVSNDSKKTFSAIVQNGQPKKQSRTVQEEWTLVQKKRRLRNRFVGSTGKAILDLNTVELQLSELRLSESPIIRITKNCPKKV